MARKLRLEFPGAIYHVINRGNYRSWIFQPAKTRAAARDATKSADWKVAVAAWLQVQTDTSNRWAATALNLGEPSAASRNLTAFFRNAPERNQCWRRLKSLSET